ncbi:MAG: M48 family metallopeptidase [Candidatus Competibacteraceae bacterium]
MAYSNPPIPEGINAPPEHPLKNLLILLGGALAVIVVVLYLLGVAAGYLARFIPFSVERDLAAYYLNAKPIQQDIDTAPITEYLQHMADQLAPLQDLPADMSITVHYWDNDQVNAFATLGGHVFINRGLLEKMPNENALTMVLGHEIAHIKHRHPIVSLGRGVVIGLGIATLVGATGGDTLAGLLGDAGLLTQLSFSRAQERQADSDGLTGLIGLYGHGAGATTPFEVFDELQRQGFAMPEFLSTHPVNEARIEALKQAIDEMGDSMGRGETQPLPDFILQALDNTAVTR